MTKGHLRLILGCCLLLALLPAAAQRALAQAPRPSDEARAIEGDLGFGYLTTDGSASLAVDTSAVFCPEPAVFVLDPNDTDTVLKSFNAKDLGDGTWEVPDPETGESVVVKVQNAGSVYADDVAEAKPLASNLPVVNATSISIVPIHWNRCWRLRRGYACGQLSSCPGGCFSGYKYVQLRNFLVCRWTGIRSDLCLDFLSPVCRLDRYTCRDCTGPIIASWLNYRYVCATF